MSCCVPGCPKLLQNWAIGFPTDHELREHWKRAIEVGTGQRLPDETVKAGAALLVCDMHFMEQHPTEWQYQEPTLFVRDNILIRVASCRLCLRQDRSNNMFKTTDCFAQGDSLQAMVDRFFTQASSNAKGAPHSGDGYFCERCAVRVDMTHTFWLEINDGVEVLERLLRKRSMEKQVLEKSDCHTDGIRRKRGDSKKHVSIKKESMLVESQHFPMVEISATSNLLGRKRVMPAGSTSTLVGIHDDHPVRNQNKTNERGAEDRTEPLNSTIVKEEPRLADSKVKHKVARQDADQLQKKRKTELDRKEQGQETDISAEQQQQHQDESSDSSEATDSIKRRPGKVYRCVMCRIKFASRREEFIHRQMHPEDAVKPKHLAVRTGGPARNLPMCNLCKTTFSSPAEVVTHFQDVHPERKFKTYTCPTCGEIFFRRPPLGTHQYLHTDTYACKECGKRHECKQHLDCHRNTAHGVPLDGYYYTKCLVCGRELKRKSFTKHMRTHNEEKQFSCDLCDKRFRERTQLRQHQRTHSGVKPLVCPTCGKAFAHSGPFCKHKKNCVGKL